MSRSVSTAEQLAAAHAGSRDAMGHLLQSFRPYLLKVARRQIAPDLSAKGGASDLVQETFAEAVRDFGRFQGNTDEEFRAWLRCLLLHHAGKLRRCYRATDKRNVSREFSIDATDGSNSFLTAQHTSPSGRVVADERLQAVERVIAALPADYREVIRLRYREQKSLPEIAEAMGRSANAVTILWFRAVRYIQEKLGAEE